MSRQAGKKGVFLLQKILRAVRGPAAFVSLGKLISLQHEARTVSFWVNLCFLGVGFFFSKVRLSLILISCVLVLIRNSVNKLQQLIFVRDIISM